MQFRKLTKNCVYLHEATVITFKKVKGSRCVGCLNSLNDKTCVNEHVILLDWKSSTPSSWLHDFSTPLTIANIDIAIDN